MDIQFEREIRQRVRDIKMAVDRAQANLWDNNVRVADQLGSILHHVQMIEFAIDKSLREEDMQQSINKVNDSIASYGK